jgi:hypothetical protein
MHASPTPLGRGLCVNLAYPSFPLGDMEGFA